LCQRQLEVLSVTVGKSTVQQKKKKKKKKKKGKKDVFQNENNPSERIPSQF